MTIEKLPDLLTLSYLVTHPTLRAYLKNVRAWHGYVRFLGLPHRRENPDVIIDRLFVEPLLTRQHVSPDDNPSTWIDGAETLFQVLNYNRPLVLLGDPGSGKSTLLNYIVWLLSRPTGTMWADRIGKWLLPVPMVLRELQLSNVASFSALLRAFLGHTMSEPLREGDYLVEMLQEGRVCVLLDGVDELGDAALRKNLRRAVFDGYRRYPTCKWVISSRIVAYEEVPFSDERSSHLSPLVSDDLTSGPTPVRTSIATSPSATHLMSQSTSKNPTEFWRKSITRYLAPFDDERITTFAKKWYLQREAAAVRAGDDAMNLVRAVRADDSIYCLARIPNLLTLMALIHRIEATLPNGRALLYDRIAEAYLESIDRYRGISSGPFSLRQKRRWLARIGYEMQLRRNEVSKDKNDQGGLLVDTKTVVSWIRQEVERSNASTDLSVRDFLDAIGRRSGLFLPRSDDHYAFVHLSFQEYFASVALEREVTGFKWARDERTELGLDRSTVADWAENGSWCESYSYLFELLASREDWHKHLLGTVFGKGYSRVKNGRSIGSRIRLANLLVELLSNRNSGLSVREREVATRAIFSMSIEFQQSHPGWLYAPMIEHYTIHQNILWKMLSGQLYGLDCPLEMLVKCAKRAAVQALELAFSGVSEIAPLSRIYHLESLGLRSTRVSDLTSIGKLSGLRKLDLSATNVVDIRPLAKIPGLRSLELGDTGVVDFACLSGLTALERLDLSFTKVCNLEFLVGLGALKSLRLVGIGALDMRLLANLRRLEYLSVSFTVISDLEPLAGLSRLRSLDVSDTKVSDLQPLAGLSRLESLGARETGVSDLRPLAGLSRLRSLDVCDSKVSDLQPLAGLSRLESLEVGHTRVSDLQPLAGLSRLRSLDVCDTKVSDLQPLAGLSRLESLEAGHTRVSDLRPLAGLNRLSSLDVSSTGVSESQALAVLSRLDVLVTLNP